MILSNSIELTFPTRVIYGLDSVNRIGDICKDITDKIFIVTNGTLTRKIGLLQKVESLLESSDVDYILYDDIKRDMHPDSIDEIGTLINQSRVKLILAVGSSSAINTAKAAAYIAKNEGKIIEYINGRIGKNEAVKLVTIPTIPGVLEALNDSFVVKDYNDKRKKFFNSPSLFPVVTILDPKITLTIPINYTVGSGFAILSNAIESYISKASNAISDALALRAIEFIGKNLKAVFLAKNDLEARSNIMMSYILTSLSLLTSKLGVCEAMALALSSRDNIYQNIAHAIMLPYVMEFNLTAVPNKYLHIARALGENITNITVVEAAIKAIEGVRKLLFDLKVPQKLSDFKVKKENLSVIASSAQQYPFVNYSPTTISKEDIYNILTTAY